MGSKVNGNVLKRVEVMEKVQADGIDWLANEIKGLFQNDGVIGSAVEEHDTTITAIKALLIEKGILTDSEIESKRADIDRIRAKEVERRKEETEKLNELKQMKSAAEDAGKEGHPPEAFIFG